MNANSRRWTETIRQGINESVVYTIDTHEWPGIVRNNIVIEVTRRKPFGGDLDITGAIIIGAPTVNGTDIEFAVHNLVNGITHRVITRWTNENAVTEECWGNIIGEP